MQLDRARDALCAVDGGVGRIAVIRKDSALEVEDEVAAIPLGEYIPDAA